MATNITIAHLADLHLGYGQYAALRAPSGQRQREADVSAAAKACADYICEQVRPDLVVIAGDAYDNTRVSNWATDDGLDVCKRFDDAGIPLVILAGNHDQSESDVSKTVVELARRTNARVVLEQEQIDIAGVRLHLLSFRAISKAMKEGRPVEFAFSPTLPNVFAAHGEIEGRGRDAVTVKRLWLDDPRFALAMLGHIHHRECVPEAGKGRAFYAGAVERLGFDEWRETPGFYVHTLTDGKLSDTAEVTTATATTWAGLEGLPRPMRVYILEAQGMTEFELDGAARALIADAQPGEVMRLNLRSVSSDFHSSGLKQAWQRLLREQGGLHLEIDAQTERMALMDVTPPTSGDIGSNFLDYLAAQEHASEAEKERRLALAREVMAAAREKLATLEEVS